MYKLGRHVFTAQFLTVDIRYKKSTYVLKNMLSDWSSVSAHQKLTIIGYWNIREFPHRYITTLDLVYHDLAYFVNG